jgi:hypothetical protein
MRLRGPARRGEMYLLFLILNLNGMTNRERQIPASRIIILFLLLLNVIVISQAYVKNEKWYWPLVITLPLFLLSLLNIRGRSAHF